LCRYQRVRGSLTANDEEAFRDVDDVTFG